VRLRRTLLFVPGTSPERIAKAATSAADGVILDLEDAVAPGEKVKARDWVVAALRRVEFGGRERIVRVNAPDTLEGPLDLEAVVPAMPDAVLVPKIGDSDVLAGLEAEVSRLEAAAGLPVGRIRLHLLIETVAGVLNALPLARASARTAGLLFGAGDLMRETRGRPVPGRGTEQFALATVLFAARAAGVDAIDTPYFDLRDAAGLTAHARAAADLGYDGKAVIHPAQVEPVNDVFTPSAAAIAEAETVLAAYDAAVAQGRGAVSLDGRFIDAVHVATARTTLSRARLAGVR
jgi:citrate lyase subunit beta/citryl-CoA lyase